MTTLDIKLTLPEPLAAEAQRMGLLEPDGLRALLADAVRTKRLARLAEARARIAAAGIEPLGMEDIEAEIAAERLLEYGRRLREPGSPEYTEADPESELKAVGAELRGRGVSA